MNWKLAASCVGALLLVAVLAPGASGAHAVDLGSADDFAVLASAGITNTGATRIIGDVGSHPTGTYTGFQTVTQTGSIRDAADSERAQTDALEAYNEAAGRPDPISVGVLDGLTLTPGVYANGAMSLAGTLILDGQNQTDAVFIFQSGSSLLLSSGSEVLLVNGAEACNVFWQVTSATTIMSGAHLEGTVLSLAGVTLGTGATVNGAVMSLDASVTLAANTITLDPCDVPTSTSSSTSATNTTSTTQSTSPSPTGSETQTTSPSPTQSETQTTSPSPTQSETQTTSPSPTQSETQTTSPSPTQSETQTTSPSITRSETQTTTSETNTTTTPIPFFPGGTAGLLASVGALGGAFLVMRRRL